MMRNMKKLIAAVLALVMIVSLSFSGFAYYTGPEHTDAAYSEKYIMALSTLYGLGILPDNTPKDLEKAVSREDFAAAAGALLGGRTIENVPEPISQTITLGEAVKMLVDGTENTIRADKYGYMGVAGQMGITHGLGRMQSYDNLTYGAFVQMLYNSMRITPGDTSVISTDGAEYEFDSNRTVLTEYLGVEYKNGFVTADGFWSLNPGEAFEENEMVINGKTYQVKYPGIEDYVGFYVNYYYSEDEDMILAVEKSANSKQVILDSDDVTGYSNNIYTCYADGNKKTYKIASDAYIINNFAPDMATDINMYPDGSDIVLIDANGDNTFETVFIKTYTGIIVTNIDAADDYMIIGKGGKSYKLSEDSPARVWLDGKKVGYSDVIAGIYASLVIEPSDKPDERIVREIYLSSGKASGEVTSIVTDDRNMKITVGETEYEANLTISDKNKVSLGMEADFLLDFKGEIVYIEIKGGSGGFGYLRLIGREGGLSKPAQMQILATDGTFPMYTISDKCKVNSEKTEEDIVKMFTDNDGKTIQQLIWFETNSKGEVSDIVLPLEDSSKLTYNDYKLHVTPVSSSYNDPAKSFTEKALLGSNTVIFNVPKTNSDNDREYAIGTVPVSSNSKLYNFEINRPFADAVVAYRNTSLSDAGVCAGPGPEIKKNDPGGYCIVKSCRKAYVEEYDDYFDKIDFVDGSSGKSYSKILADNAIFVQFGTANNQREVVEYSVGQKNLKPGDIFHYSQNIMGEIGTVHKFYDAAAQSLVKGTSTENDKQYSFDYSVTSNFGGWANAYIRGIQGYVVDAASNYVALTRTGPSSIDTIKRSDLEFFAYNKYSYVYEITMNGKDAEVKKISLGALTPAMSADEHCILTTGSGGVLRLVAVYKTAD